MTLTKKVIKQIKGNPQLVAGICAVTGKSYPTIMRWLSINSRQLTAVDCLNFICKELKLTQDEVLQPQKTA